VIPEVWHIDLTSFESVRAFAKRCDTNLERLDIFVSCCDACEQGRKA
jgi:NAD(P)-dependent dehydrogenase (short-subunit alcohol dehydrogenase family)